MKRVSRYIAFLLFLSLTLSSLMVQTTSAQLGQCNKINPSLPDPNTVRAKIEQCYEARKSGNPNSIEDFVCPQGDFIGEGKQALNEEVVAYLVAVNLSFNKIDADIEKYMRELQTARVDNHNTWIENYRVCFNGIGGQRGVEQIYNSICDFPTIPNLLNTGSPKQYIKSTEAYPQPLQLCRDRAKAKLQGWTNLANTLTADGLYKFQKNSVDTWITEVKGAYGKVLTLWQVYQRILARAVSKMDVYIRNSN